MPFDLAANVTHCHHCLHRQRGVEGLPTCLKNGRPFVENAKAGACPINAFAAPPSRAAGAEPSIAEAGPGLWAELHAWARACDPSTAAAWLEGFAGRLPCGECRGHWLQLLAAFPPDYADNERLYAWTVEAHNRVNERLGKPRWTPPPSTA